VKVDPKKVIYKVPVYIREPGGIELIIIPILIAILSIILS